MYAEIESTCESSARVSTATIHVLIWANEALVPSMNEESYRSRSVPPSFLSSVGRELFMNNTYTRRLKTTMTRLLEIESHVRPIMYSSLFGHFT